MIATPENNLFPPLGTLYFYLTEGCNLRCRHCYINPKYQAVSAEAPAIAVKTFVKIIDQAIPLGLRGVKLTGGEPMLHPQIDELLEIIQQRDLVLSIETNGCLITPLLAQKIARSRQVSISVSIDSCDRETHEWMRGVKGSFDDAVAGVKNLVAAGLRPQLIMSLVKKNREHIEGVVSLAQELGCESVKFNVIQPTERGAVLSKSDDALSVADYIEICRYITADLQKKTPIRLFFSLPPAFLPMSTMFSGFKQGCGSGCGIKSILGILWNGSISICGIGEVSSELVLGNIEQDTLADIWSKNKTICSIRTGLPDAVGGVCQKCIFKSKCFGSCPAHNYVSSGDLFSPGWFCQSAYDQGLFPQSRLHTI